MRVLGKIGIVAVLIVIVFLIYLSRYGLFSPVEITEKEIGPYLLVYKKHIGDYKEVGLVMDRLFYDLKDNYGVTTTKGFGLYYDNPQVVAKEKLRSIVGCIIEGKSFEDIEIISDKYGVKEYPA